MMQLLIAALLVQDKKDPVKVCADNLRQLWAMEYTYTLMFGGKEKKMPAATGQEFWLALTRTKPPLLDDTQLDVLVCPLSKEKPRAGFTTYRGPSKVVAALSGEDPVGCCVHPDGSVIVLYKTGDVQGLKAGDPAAKAAVEATQGAAKK